MAFKIIVVDDDPLALESLESYLRGAGYDVAGGAETDTSRAYTRSVFRLLGLVFGAVLLVVVLGEWLGLLETVTERIPWPVWLAAILAVVGFLYYTVIYTRFLKRSTWQNIVIEDGAGAIPPMIGWAAASGRLSLTALVLFAIVFYWTPPHFWALALLKRKDYAAAGVPMLPVVAGDGETARQILIYSFGMFALTLMLVPVQAMGGVYLVGAIALGAWFLWLAWRVNHEHTPQAALKLYVYSLLYLFALFAVMMVDRIVL